MGPTSASVITWSPTELFEFISHMTLKLTRLVELGGQLTSKEYLVSQWTDAQLAFGESSCENSREGLQDFSPL